MEIEWARIRDAVYATASKRLAQSKLRHMQDEWLRMKADAIQAYADGKDTENFYSALKTVYGSTLSGSSPILSADGYTIFSDKEKILERWAEHFNSVLNRPSTINGEAVARLPRLRPSGRNACKSTYRSGSNKSHQVPVQPKGTWC